MGTETMDHEGKIAVTVKVASQMLSLGCTKLYELMATGQLKTVYIGRRRLIPVAELERVLREGAK